MMTKTAALKNAMSATRTATKLFDTSQEEHATRSDDEPLSRTDRFFITSMLADEYPPPVSLSEDTIIGGSSTLSSIMELGRCELCNDLKLKDPFESMYVMHLLSLQKVAWDCFAEVQKNRNDLHAQDINLRYAFTATDTFIKLYDQLERRWAKQTSIPSGERVLVPLTPNTLIDGATLRQIMEWDRVELYLSLKAQNPFESILADLIVRTHKAGLDCYEQADWKRHNPDVREMNLKYGLKGTDSSARLLARLEGYRAQQIERVLHNSATGGQKLGKVASSRFDRHSKKQDKARVNLSANGKHA
jgi:hypothetical protein